MGAGIRRFDLDSSGLSRVLGELEARIMESVWQRQEATGREICDDLGPKSHYKTVLTVANRMVEKGLLSRERAGARAFIYRANEDRDAFLDRISARVANGLLLDFGNQALARFVEAAVEIDPAYLAELERLVQEHKEGM